MRPHTHYDTLKVAKNAPFAVIKAAYKVLAQQHHPDRNPNDLEAAKFMSLLNQAYDVLSNPERRQQYDAALRKMEGEAVPPTPTPPKQPTPSSASKPNSPKAAGASQSSGNKATANTSTSMSSSSLLPKNSVAIVGALLFFVALFKISASWQQHNVVQESRQKVPSTTPPASPKSPLAPALQANPPADPLPPVPSHSTSLPKLDSTSISNFGLTATVSSEQLNVRNGPGTNFDVIGKLSQGVPVVIRGDEQGSWIAIVYGAETGYVNKKLLDFKRSTVTAAPMECQVKRPPLGTVLLRNGTGPHQLQVQAPFDSDVYVKLKNIAGNTVFAGFVTQGQSFTFEGIPDGSYQAWFATGRNFSDACHRFMTNMAATFDPGFQDYRTSVQGNYIYHQIMKYSLQFQRNGNFSTQVGSVDNFMSD